MTLMRIGKASIVLTAYAWLCFFAACSNDSEDDILTATYPFANSCTKADGSLCTNYYPEDNEPFDCATADTSSNDKCSATNSIGACAKLPRTSEIVYYNSFGSVDAARANCSLIGQSQFSDTYSP